ncbi:thioesterase II family protein [Paenarthrobacter sp. NPDC089675]|uniref:thioesterase II family protein n=1 Tax=Paenarthrobacter sp. NPDC089675 TaxID=3364376 RepID=UPI00380D1CDD
MVTLFCFAYAGGVASEAFSKWQELLGPEVTIVPLDYPGRGQRHLDAHATCSLDLVREMADTVRRMLDPNTHWAVFGHSMGAMVAYEVARLLSRDPSVPDPAVVFVSGRRPPGDSPLSGPLPIDENALIKAAASWGGIPPEFIMKPHLQPLITEKLRIDLALGTHPGLDLPPLKCPVRVLSGTSDPLVDVFQLSRWSETTLEHTGIHLFEGDHFFIRPGLQRVLGVVLEALRNECGLSGSRVVPEALPI